MEDQTSAEKMASVFRMLPEEARNAAYVQANCFNWPDALMPFKAAGLDEMTAREKYHHPAWQEMFEVIESNTTHFGRSRAWWLINLKRTKEQHAEWYATHYGQS